MKRIFSMTLCLFLLLVCANCSAAKLIKNIPCQRIIDVDTDEGVNDQRKRYGIENKNTKYSVYYYNNGKNASENCLMIVTRYNTGTIINGKDIGVTFDGPGIYSNNISIIAERIISYHTKRGEISQKYSYVWFAASGTDKLDHEYILHNTGIRLYNLA